MQKYKENIMKYIILSIVILMLFVGMACTSEQCERCHEDIAENFSASLHATGLGMFRGYEDGAMKHFGLNTTNYYEQKNCQKCHVVSCTQCHLGGSYHTEFVSMDACDPCHKKKQTSLYQGQMPMHKSGAPNADIHYEKGLVCQDCHTSNEIHGDGTDYNNQMLAVNVQCIDCHKGHKDDINHENLDCDACHTGFQLTCQNCHIETRKGTKPVSHEFYLAKNIDGMVSPVIKMDAEYQNKTHTLYGDYYYHTTTKNAKNCSFCHDDASIYVVGNDTIFYSNMGSVFTQDEVDAILSIDTEPKVKVSFIDRIKFWLDLK